MTKYDMWFITLREDGSGVSIPVSRKHSIDRSDITIDSRGFATINYINFEGKSKSVVSWSDLPIEKLKIENKSEG